MYLNYINSRYNKLEFDKKDRLVNSKPKAFSNAIELINFNLYITNLNRNNYIQQKNKRKLINFNMEDSGLDKLN
ncbi:hypothetical protein BpHYR1_039648 [Brachionus plicatilis]|uniref:Uncharacterized protein n=1 Tax=Brachionus plicatilis TaxID=10195 RepID=A0A3M7S8B5_BRAPC|nr:hypothetical protein BpHYR1_039648 [Brachionus plicatilis]